MTPAVLVGAGAALLVVAALSARGTLRRNRWVGIRTRATMASDAAWAAAHRAAAAPTAVGGAVLVAGGIAIPFVTNDDRGVAGAGLAIAILGVSIVGFAAVVGVRAARRATGEGTS